MGELVKVISSLFRKHNDLAETAGNAQVNTTFLCDEMLKELARWLRAAGYDTLVGPDQTNDAELLRMARLQGRIFLTRDRRFFEALNDRRGVVLLECNDLDGCFQEVSRRLGVDWLYRPFSRCLACNALLVEADPERWRDVPVESRAAATRLLYCPNCRQLFWDGSHVMRMQDKLKRAAALSRSTG